MTALDLGHSHVPPRLGRRWRRRLTAGLVLLLVGGVSVSFFGPPVMLMNTTPSEPPGLYVRTAASVQVGRIIAFHLPPMGLGYVEKAMPYLRHRPLLKAVAAGPGDWVCTRDGVLQVNGRRLGEIAGQDHLGRSLPHWVDCRTLAPDELFVYSARVPNSFDSRYYGPVSKAAVLGVYRRLQMANGSGT